MLRFGHQTVFGLCITVFLLTGTVVASVTLMLFERQDVAVLQQRIADLSNENAALKRQLQQASRLERITAPAHTSEQPTNGEQRLETISAVGEPEPVIDSGQTGR
jgi:cell division protein FtsL